jgi:hypothetical protein
MTEPNDDQMPEDDVLMDQLRRALVADTPSDALLRAAKDSLTWRSVDAELAALLSDSAIDELAGMRSTDTSRALEFAAGETSVAVEIIESATSFEVRGQIDPAGATSVTFESPAGNTTLAVDAGGWFAGQVLSRGPIRLRAAGIVTDWFSI